MLSASYSAPRICDFGATTARDCVRFVATAARLGFGHVIVPAQADLPSLAAEARKSGLGLIADINLFESNINDAWVRENQDLFAIRHSICPGRIVDPRNIEAPEGRALARFYEDPDKFLAWWSARLQSALQAGATGFRIHHPDQLDAKDWQTLFKQARAIAPGTLFIADTIGVTRDALAQLADAQFDYSSTSLPWWDRRAPWLVEEYEAALRNGRVLASAGMADQLAPASATLRQSKLILAAISGQGVVTPLNFVTPGGDIDSAFEDQLLALNEIVQANSIVAQAGTLRSLTGPGAPITVLLRTETPDISASPRALVALVNTDPNTAIALARISAATGAWDIGHADILAGGTGDHLAPGEARLLQVARQKPVRRSNRAPARDVNYAAKQPRILISNISPSVDGPDHAVKRVVGDAVTVEADILTDGHPLLVAELLFRADDEKIWQRIDMQPLGNDRWQARFPLQREGRHRFAVEAWLDGYGGFARDLAKKNAAGQDVTVDLLDGRKKLVSAAQRATDALKAPLTAIVGAFDGLQDAEQVTALLAPDTIQTMRHAEERRFLAQSAAHIVDADRLGAHFASWYELFPRSQTGDPARHGTFADVIARLPAIQAMGFDVLYLPPIHPIGKTNRKGRENATVAGQNDPGSVYAIGSKEGGHDAIHPELGTLDDFRALIAAARAHSMEIALDFAVQCSPDHPWLRAHPGWFDWRSDGSIKYAENPPKKYEDIVNVDFYARDAVPGLWLALRDIVLFWAQTGVRIFRVDNPHTKPLPFWQWLIADIRGAYPDVIFLAEAFTRPKLMYALAKLGFTQSYTYFTWRNRKDELTDYMRELTMPPVSDFFRPHFFVNTPDINPYFLQTSGRAGFLIRAVLAATLSGLWGIYSGFELCEAAALPSREEYADSEKYAVKPRNWTAPGNIIAEIAQLNRLRRAEPALQTQMGVTFYNAFNGNILYYGKHAPGEATRLLVIVSLNPKDDEEADFEIPLWEWGLPDGGALAAEDIFSGARFTWHGKIQHIRLTPDAPFRIWRVSPATEA